MRILNSYKYENCPTHIDDIHLNEEWAKKIHNQTLKRLNERMGLSPFEIYMNINKLKYQQAKEIDGKFDDKEAVTWLNSYLELHKTLEEAL